MILGVNVYIELTPVKINVKLAIDVELVQDLIQFCLSLQTRDLLLD